MDSVAPVDVAVVIPNFNGERWLPGVLESVAAQTAAPAEVVVVDDASTDASRALLAERFPHVRVVARAANGGFARAANDGIGATTAEAVALVNTDVVLDPRWLETARAALAGTPARRPSRPSSSTSPIAGCSTTPATCCGATASASSAAASSATRAPTTSPARCSRPARARRCTAAPRSRPPAASTSGSACTSRTSTSASGSSWPAGPAAGSRAPSPRTRGEGSSGGAGAWVERNTLLLVARAFPLRWLPYVAYRQAAWAWHAARAGELGTQLAGVRAALPLLPAFARERGAVRAGAAVPVESVVPARPIRGPRAGGHPSRHAR